MKKRIAAVILSAAMAVTSFTGIDLLHITKDSEVTAEAADTDGTPYDPVLIDENDKVIVVDAGHGGSDSGAVGHGYKEKNLTLQIATALKDRLQAYNNVHVLMTRNTDTYVGLTDRTNYAGAAEADAFVSVHLNSAGSSAHGAEVWYPNSNYDYSAYTTGKELAANVLAGLVNMGLTSRGYSYKSSTVTKYADGSAADYYAVIRGSKQHHIPGIIIEGAFISSSSDVDNYLSTDEDLTAMGTTDADAVAKTFGLTLKTGAEVLPDYTSMTSAQLTGNGTDVAITWQPSANSSQYIVFRKSGVNGTWQEIARTTGNSWTDATASYGTTYYYTVIGKNDNGRALTYDTQGLAVTTPRKDIVTTSAVDEGLRKVKVTWQQDPAATGYRLYRSTNGGGYKKITTIKKNVSSYTDETASASTAYSYVVKSYTAKEKYSYPGRKGTTKTITNNIWSTCQKPGASVTTDADAIGTLVGAPEPDNKSITFTWDQFPDDVTYRIYRKTNSGSYTKIADTKDLTFTDTTVVPGNSYKYRMRAYRKGIHNTTSTYWTGYTNVFSYSIAAIEAPSAPVDNGETTSSSSEAKQEAPVQASTDKKETEKKETEKATTDKQTTTKKTSSAKGKNGSTITMKDATQKAFGRVAIHWNASAPYKGSKEKVYYRLYRKTGSGKYAMLKDVTTKYATDTGALDATSKYENPDDYTFTYRVRSYFLNGTKKVWSPYSDEVTVRMNVTPVKWRSAYQAVKSSTDKTNYDNDDRDYVTPASDTSLTLHWYPVEGASGYQILDENGKRVTSVKGADINQITISDLSPRTTYTYMVRPYKTSNKKNYFGLPSTAASGTTAYVIKGASNTNPAQMARYYNNNVKKKKNGYPSATYAQYGAPDINTFAQIVYDEANKAGVKAEVLFAQICKETNFLNFGGDVKVSQCNFGGIGAIGGGAGGADFVSYARNYYSALGYATPDAAVADAVRVGVRAQAVHLALYATTDGNRPSYYAIPAVDGTGTITVPDPRAFTSIIGTAPYCEWLGIKDNHNTTGEATADGKAASKGWAAANNYGYSLVSDYVEPLLKS